MDPITGLAALAGISLATVAGLRLKKNMNEGFGPLPDTNTQYPQSVEESQSRYNMFSGLVNPLTNGLIPVGSSESAVEEKRNLADASLGSYKAEFSPNSSQTVILRNFENKYKPRADDEKSLFEAIKFCRETGKGSNPFSVTSKDGNFKFEEICGVCISSGVDEEGNRFRRPQGMLVDPGAKELAFEEKEAKGWAFARVKPAIGTCEGAPNEPVFATNQEDLDRYGARAFCINNKTLGTRHSCALCYESDNVYSSVPDSTQRNPISLVLQGTGRCVVKVGNRTVGNKVLSETESATIELLDGKEDDTFLVEVEGSQGSQVPTNVYGYMMSKTPKDGLFTMPLNLVVTVDDVTGTSPSKSGGFHNFTDVGLGVAKMRPGVGRTTMRLRGKIPFTFVQSGELAAMDCLEAPYQKLASSASAFATDQPCFAKGAKPGNYNADCLRQRILDVGCTNAGTLFQNPLQLNTKNGVAQSLVDIYSTLLSIAENDMIEVEATKQCTGRDIQTPCDPFIERAGTLKLGTALRGTNQRLATQAQQCLSFLYHNKGANEKARPPRVGPTYTGLVTYKNNQKEIKNIFCLPDGKLNPDTNTDGRDTLARVADNGFGGKVGVEAVKAYLNDQLSVATDMTRNGNADPERKAAILNCFGTDFKSLPALAATDPTVIQNPCGVVAQYVRVQPSQQAIGEPFIEISQLAVIDKNGENVALGKSTEGSTGPYPPHGFGTHNASFAIDGQVYPKRQNFYVSATSSKSNQFLLNLGKPTDITKIIYIGRGDHPTSYRKNLLRLELLDQNQTTIWSRALNSNMREDIVLLQQGADSSCKSELPAPAPLVFPPGHTPGVYIRFFDITDPNPDITPGNRGWGEPMGTPNAYGRIVFNDWNLARHDRCGVVAKGYYIAQGRETLHLMVDSDDGVYVTFNNRQVIRNWTIHAPQRDTAAPIEIPAAGVYPFELRFYEWGGGAVCTLYYKINDEADWRTDMTTRFSYKPDDVQRENEEIEAAKRAAREQERLRIEAERIRLQNSALSVQSFTPGYNVNGGSVQNNGDYIVSFNIKPTGYVGDWASIFRFRITQGNCCNFGQRAPAVWFWPWSTQLHVIIGDATDGNWGVHNAGSIPMNQETQIVIECKGNQVRVARNTPDGTGNIMTYFVTQPSRRPTGRATLLLGDGDYPPAQCRVTNFKYTPLN